jgi:hypothetical protein
MVEVVIVWEGFNSHAPVAADALKANTLLDNLIAVSGHLVVPLGFE